MIPNRTRDIVIKSQFNINGSRGQDAGKFVADYVSRNSATDASMAYIPLPTTPPVEGDGVAFTLDSTAISRAETLRLADKIQEFHKEGNRAIQQMVISFDVDYLVEQGLVNPDATILEKGDYEFEYDDIRLRHAVRKGMQSLIDAENYRDGRMVAAIQHDTLHLHVHAVVYENHPKLARKRGAEEKGVIKESSFNQLSYDIDRYLTLTRTPSIPSQRTLLPHVKKERVVNVESVPSMDFVNQYLQILKQQEESRRLMKQLEMSFDIQEDEQLDEW